MSTRYAACLSDDAMHLSPELFLQQCKRRFGNANPERMHIEHWEWMIRNAGKPFFVRQELGLPTNFPSAKKQTLWQRLKLKPVEIEFDGPDWCFHRFGQSRTYMPDGRIICIGGEHEDFYDPDFCIYNDVVVLRPEPGQSTVTSNTGDVEIYGYPKAQFPPTDFHSATLVGDRIYIIGALGYADARREGETPVFVLDTASYRIEPVATRGACPGWIHEHYGSYDPAAHAITVRGAKTFRVNDQREAPIRTAHRLHLEMLEWEFLGKHDPDQNFRLMRHGQSRSEVPAELFRPSIPHEWLGIDGAEQVSIGVQGYRVTFDSGWDVDVRIEGAPPADLVDALLDEILANLRAHTGCRWSIEKADT